MASTLLRRFGPLLLSGGMALGITATAKAEEIRIGFLSPTTGVFAQVGKDMVDGFKMYLDEKNNKLGGADIKLIVEDEQGKPDTAVTKAKKLILQDKVHFLVGGLLAVGRTGRLRDGDHDVWARGASRRDRRVPPAPHEPGYRRARGSPEHRSRDLRLRDRRPARGARPNVRRRSRVAIHRATLQARRLARALRDVLELRRVGLLLNVRVG